MRIFVLFFNFESQDFFMINFNGTLVNASNAKLAIHNRGYAYGDALFETIRVNKGTLLFWEDHYFRLMSGMRILRMEIPMHFTMEALEIQILDCIAANELANATVRVKFTVNRIAGGLYTPDSNAVRYIITVSSLEDVPFYKVDSDREYEIALFKDHYVASGLLSTLKTNNKLINVLGSIYAKENGCQNCLLLNTEKKVIEALNGNLFLVKGTHIKTPPLVDGCLKGVLRKQLLAVLEQHSEYTIVETSISPFELQKADELFITNVIQGIVPISKFRKKEFQIRVSKKIVGLLNARIRLARI